MLFVRVLVGKSAVMPDLPTWLARKCFERLASRPDVWATHGRPSTMKELAIIEEIVTAIREALEEAEKIVRKMTCPRCMRPIEGLAAALAALREST